MTDTTMQEAPIAEATADAVAQPSEQQSDAEAFYNEQPAETAPADEGETPAEGAEGEEGEGEQEEQPDPIAAPVSWAKDAKEVFAGLPREAQEIIATREADRERLIRNKTMEAAQTRQTVETEARTALLQIQRNHMMALQQFAGVQEVAPPDVRLLESQDPRENALYYEQDRAYRISTAQRENITHQLSQAQQLAEQIEHQQQQSEFQAVVADLEQNVPEWSDPSERANLLASLEPIAAELGYSAEVMSQANATDINGLKKVRDWKRDADKYRALNKRRMVPVRAAKQIPPAARPGSPAAGSRQPVDAVALMYPDDQPRR